MHLNIALIMPAAGMSTRHPPNKLLIPVQGQAAIIGTLSSFQAFEWDSYVILGYMGEEIRRTLESAVLTEIIYEYNVHFSQGLSGSIRTGIQAAGPTYDYWCLCNADKPFIQEDTIAFLVELLQRERPTILAPMHHGIPGHPMFFSSQLMNDFLELEGDQSAGTLLDRFPRRVLRTQVSDEGIVLDMDRYLDRRI